MTYKLLFSLRRKLSSVFFLYLLIYRFVGGVPWQLSCLLPTIFNVKISNFYFATLIGIIPTVFLMVSIGNGLEKVIDQNSEISFSSVLFSPDIYFPLIGFFIILIIAFAIKKFYFKQ